MIAPKNGTRWIWPLVLCVVVLIAGGWHSVNTRLALSATSTANAADAKAVKSITNTEHLIALIAKLEKQLETVRLENRQDHRALEAKIDKKHE